MCSTAVALTWLREPRAVCREEEEVEEEEVEVEVEEEGGPGESGETLHLLLLLPASAPLDDRRASVPCCSPGPRS